MIPALFGFAAVLILVLLRMPIVFAMGLVGIIGYSYQTSVHAAVSMAARLIIDTSQDYGLSVVPLFILMGLFVNKGGLSHELYRVSYAFLGQFRGGLAMATIVACGGFSAICGSSLATAATMSKVAMPQMRKFGYSDQLSTASIAAGGHARHFDPAQRHFGDLRIIDRNQHRQIVHCRHYTGCNRHLVLSCRCQIHSCPQSQSRPRRRTCLMA